MPEQRVRLIPIDRSILEWLNGPPSAAGPPNGPSLAGVEGITREIVVHTLERMPERPLPWCSYLTVDDDQDQVVGTCAFKSQPYGDGEVEIAYFTFEPFEGKGYGRAAAGALVETARAVGVLERVIAHTLPEANYSTRILEGCGFRYAGEVDDPEDGPVWRWELDVGA